ncbi:MAG: GIY-YIG nuclease family protein [Lentisphaerales bacterium]|nr:MAG: GIY-YIG nuclease family protein [Lentisphaerales bacterium]
MSTSAWYVYIVQCRGGSLYTGITNDLAKREEKHNAGKGANWTRVRRPVKMVYAEKHASKSAARKREIEIKGWRREKKLALITSDTNILRNCPSHPDRAPRGRLPGSAPRGLGSQGSGLNMQ